MGRMESDLWVKEDPKLEWIRRINFDNDEGKDLTAGLPGNFSGKEEDATRWILAMMAYFILNRDIYDEEVQTLVTLNKMSTGRGVIFTKGWY